MSKSRCKTCKKLDEKDNLYTVSHRHLQAGRLFHCEPKIECKGTLDSLYYLCQTCNDKYHIIGQEKPEMPYSVTAEHCAICKHYASSRCWDGWTVDFETLQWCHRKCIGERKARRNGW